MENMTSDVEISSISDWASTLQVEHHSTCWIINGSWLQILLVNVKPIVKFVKLIRCIVQEVIVWSFPELNQSLQYW